MSQEKCYLLAYVTIEDGVPLQRFPDPVKDADRFISMAFEHRW